MPELPEVEAQRLLIERNMVNKKIDRVETIDDANVFKIPHGSFAAALKGRTVLEAGRRGKNLFILLGGEGSHAVIHLGMTGCLRVKGVQAQKFVDFKTDQTDWPPPYWKFVIVADDGTEMCMTDVRRFGSIHLLKDPLNEPPISSLAPDPYLKEPEAESFRESIKAAVGPAGRTTIKGLLLDQEAVVCGVGNWVADEVLYHARIHPSQPVSSLSDGRIEDLRLSLVNVLEKACEVEADSDRFPSTWLFHHRWFKGKGKKGAIIKVEGGHTVKFLTVAGRTSAVVPAVQKLTGGLNGSKAQKKGDNEQAQDSQDGCENNEEADAKEEDGERGESGTKRKQDALEASDEAGEGQKKRPRPQRKRSAR
ncbi:DNA glycosylase/AP lyase [Cladochytrium replicatum]|nr:DNA glycosylase/AP lyase [Cladochytrium replicatum]